MRKILLGLAATAAIAVPLSRTAANAAVSYEPTHDGVITGHVDKSDVQSLLRWNEAKVQSTPVNFSSTFSVVQDKSYGCADGVVEHGVQTIAYNMGITASEVRGGAGQKIKGWDLTGMGALSDMTVTKTGPAGFGDACATHGGLVSYRVDQDHALGDTIKVNGLGLPETTPIVVPTV